MGRTKSRRLRERLRHAPGNAPEASRRSPGLQLRLELLEDRVQPGDTILGLSAMALWGLDYTALGAPLAADIAAHDRGWHHGLFARLEAAAALFPADSPSIEAASATISHRAGTDPTAETAGGFALPLLASAEALAGQMAVYRLAGPALPLSQGLPANLSVISGGVGSPWLAGSVSSYPFGFAGIGNPGHGALGLRPVNLSFDVSTGQLAIQANAGDHTVREALAPEGFVDVTLDGGHHSSNPQAADFDTALAGATGSSLNSIRVDAATGHDTLVVDSQSLTHGLRVMAPGADVVTQDVAVGGPLEIHAENLMVRGALRSEAITLTVSGWGNVEKAGRLEAAQGDAGGRIQVAADVFVNTGQLHADGRNGGQTVVQARNILNAGPITAEGKSPGADGGVVRLTFTDAYIDTTAARTSADGALGGSVVIDGGSTGHLFSSGRHFATGSAKGGTIDLFGGDVVLAGATVDASGEAGGGAIRVGGDFQGRNPVVANAQTLTVSSASRLRADARGTGDGGRVILWSEGQTTFDGSVLVRGGSARGRGGWAEVSGKGGLAYAGTADAGATAGKGGTLLLDPKNLVIAAAPAGVFPQYDLIDPHPTPGGGFGNQVFVLSNGNVVVTNPNDNFGGRQAGGAYLFDGSNGALISSLVGSRAKDFVGYVAPLNNGNYVVLSPNWNAQRGAATWGNGSTGVSGTVSDDNSLVGSKANDYVGNNGITPLSNGNYVVRSVNWNDNRGAVTWGDGSTGVNGTVSDANSLVGSKPGDQVGQDDLIPLDNGNYVVRSVNWNDNRGAATWGSGTTGVSGAVSEANSLVGNEPDDQVGIFITPLSSGDYLVGSPNVNAIRGAVTWGDGSTGVRGTVSEANSLVGSHPNDRVGAHYECSYYDCYLENDVTPLSNGNYVVRSPSWNGQRGAVTWGNGSTGVSGIVSEANSLVGSKPNAQVGVYGLTPLSNGNYVVLSANGQRGAVTWGDGSMGITGTVSEANSLVGSKPNDQVGQNGVTPLSNGNYVVRSPNWNDNRGAVTWVSSSTGVSGTVSDANSLVGSNPGDQIGANQSGDSVFALSNGNFVVVSSNWNDQRGAVTWGNGSTGVSGIVSAANSLVGSKANDLVGQSGVTPLSNGNYVVGSSNWNDARGAVTWGSGSAGINGTVSAANSLVGSKPNDTVGQSVTPLSNGNYVVLSPNWNAQRGAATWGSGTSGVSGTVSDANSLVGSNRNDYVGSGVVPLSNGNYVVLSPSWKTNRGAATWGIGASGVSGTISESNSLVGSRSNDQVGQYGVTPLNNGNYLVSTPNWNGNRGAVTWVSGTTGRTADGGGIITPQNSLVGRVTNAGLGGIALDPTHESFLASFVSEGRGRVTVGLTDPNQFSYARGETQTVTLTPDFLSRTLNSGTAVVLQASNDITVNSPIAVSAGGSGGSLTLQAGRSIILNANITTDNGALVLIANDQLAEGVVDSQRDPGQAVITMAPDTTLDTGSGTLTVELRDGAGLTNPDSGAITLQTVSAGSVAVVNNGPTAGSDVSLGPVTTTGAQSYANPNGTTLVTGSLTATDNTITFNHSVALNAGLTLSAGADTVNFSAGTVALSPGVVTVAGGVVLTGSTTLSATLNGTDPGSYSQLAAGGPINLGGSTLSLVLGFEPPVGSTFEIITNTGSVPISGTFNDLAEGTIFTQGSYQFQITYQGGTGGDSVVLTRLQ